jgi:ketosteroid isomerase-like protein
MMNDRNHQDDSIWIVETFLRAMEARDITGAKAFVSNDFEMVFPGGATA